MLPNPFGSVFLLNGALMPGEFDLVHCMISDALGISIDDRFLFVLLWDRAERMRGCALADWYRTHSSRIQNASEKDRPQVAYMTRHVWGLKSLMNFYCGGGHFVSAKKTTLSKQHRW